MPAQELRPSAALAALAAQLIGVRELAVRAAAEELDTTLTLADRAGRLAEGLAGRLNALGRTPGMPATAADLLAWLAQPHALQAALEGHDEAATALPRPILQAVAQAWQDVTGASLLDWLPDARLLAGEPLQRLGICPLISQVNGGLEPRSPESLEQAPRLPLKPLGAAERRDEDASAATSGYAVLWRNLVDMFALLPTSTETLDRLWLDALTGALDAALHAVPTDAFVPRPLDSLADLARITAACAACLVEHAGERRPDGSVSAPYRFVLGEFSPIQSFILSVDAASPWPTEAVIGGRSAFVKLSADLAALRVLDDLGMPLACRMVSAASKFMLLVPSTRRGVNALVRLGQSFDEWGLRELGGTGGLVMSWWMAPASALRAYRKGLRSSDYANSFAGRYRRLLWQLEDAKFRRFHLTDGRDPVLHHHLLGLREGALICSLDGRSLASPAPYSMAELLDGTVHDAGTMPALSPASAAQLALFSSLRTSRWLSIENRRATSKQSDQQQGEVNADAAPAFDYLGYDLRLSPDAPPPRSDRTVHVLDISPVMDAAAGLEFRGHPQHPIAPYSGVARRAPKAMLKGDVDRLGKVFQEGLPGISLGRLCQLSRQIEYFFTAHVPWLLREQHPRIQTVLAGGDDFCFIGEAPDVVQLADTLRAHWRAYTQNDSLTFSVGIAIGAARMPLADIDRQAEDALALAKGERGSVGFMGRSVPWARWGELIAVTDEVTLALQRLIPAEAPAALLATQQQFARRLLSLCAGLSEVRAFTRLRWRAHLHQAVATLVRTHVHHQAQVDLAATEASRLIDALDTRGFARHGQDMAIVGQVLLLRLQRLAPAPDTAVAHAPPPLLPQDEAPEPALAALLEALSWSQPDEALFGATASQLARSLRKIPKRALRSVLRELREWDDECDQQDHAFALMRPRMAVASIRPRMRDQALPEVAAIRRLLLERIESAAELHCARWFWTTVLSFMTTQGALASLTQAEA